MTPAARLIRAFQAPAPQDRADVAAWSAEVADALIELDPNARHPMPEVLLHRLPGPTALPLHGPLWVIAWGLGAWPTTPAWQGPIGRLLSRWWPQIRDPNLAWPPLWPPPATLAQQAGWSQLATLSAAAWPQRASPISTLGREEAWTTASLSSWPELARPIWAAPRPERHHSLRRRRLIVRAWQAQAPEVALALGAGEWLEGHWPLSVPMGAPATQSALPVQPLLDALTQDRQLEQAHQLALVLDHVLQPALLGHRPELWTGAPRSTAASSPGIRLWQRAQLASWSQPQAVFAGAGPTWWRQLVGERAHLWRQGWAYSGSTPQARWQALVDASPYRMALATWAILALGPCVQAVFEAPCIWGALPKRIRQTFLQATLAAWRAQIDQRTPATDLPMRWAAVGLWRTARAHPQERGEFLPALLGHLALVEGTPAATRGWAQLGRWARADPEAAWLDSDLQATLAFLDQASLQARWRALRLAHRRAQSGRRRPRA